MQGGLARRRRRQAGRRAGERREACARPGSPCMARSAQSNGGEGLQGKPGRMLSCCGQPMIRRGKSPRGRPRPHTARLASLLGSTHTPDIMQAVCSARVAAPVGEHLARALALPCSARHALCRCQASLCVFGANPPPLCPSLRAASAAAPRRAGAWLGPPPGAAGGALRPVGGGWGSGEPAMLPPSAGGARVGPAAARRRPCCTSTCSPVGACSP